jgi:hypothetical protein
MLSLKKDQVLILNNSKKNLNKPQKSKRSYYFSLKSAETVKNHSLVRLIFQLKAFSIKLEKNQL